MEEKKKNTDKEPQQHSHHPNYPAPQNGSVLSRIISFQVLCIHFACGLSVASSFWISHIVYSISLITDPFRTLQLISAIQAVVVTFLYSLLRHDHSKCSYLRAIFRGILSIPAGALIIAFGAIVLGAPSKHFWRTVNWSLLMSVLTVVLAACVYGLSWSDWHRIFAQTKPGGPRDYMICLPAHGAVIGAWFGAWPMPLDWERAWQEWPICVTYGAIGGYIIGMMASFGFTLVGNWRQHIKGE